ncbi:hypothetical protein P7K49_012662 [Saguinus oedipus]|uniref:Uncharacterized protein n=1 Tax=Saguinus oedipus TaxID=9490 RepID=A0ABQ9VGN3_SAGOE|nr:hypothetical protein P7K49_012662 [Saguinus oedipus]
MKAKGGKLETTLLQLPCGPGASARLLKGRGSASLAPPSLCLRRGRTATLPIARELQPPRCSFQEGRAGPGHSQDPLPPGIPGALGSPNPSPPRTEPAASPDTMSRGGSRGGARGEVTPSHVCARPRRPGPAWKPPRRSRGTRTLGTHSGGCRPRTRGSAECARDPQSRQVPRAGPPALIAGERWARRARAADTTGRGCRGHRPIGPRRGGGGARPGQSFRGAAANLAPREPQAKEPPRTAIGERSRGRG